MTFFADLTQYSYAANAPEAGVLNVGWLDRGYDFPTGTTTTQFREALAKLCANPIGLHRGFHECHLCSFGSRHDWPRIGNGQIRVQNAEGIWFVAPTMIYHYVSEHDYLPPPNFIAAVLNPQSVAERIPHRQDARS